MERTKVFGGAAVAACCILPAGPALAGGFNLDHQNAAALGAAFAGSESRASDAGHAVYNPAAIGGLDRAQLSLAFTGVMPSVDYENAAGALLGVAPITGASSGDGVIKDAVVPNISFAAPVSDRLTLGVVVNATFGFTTKFEPDSVVRYQALKSSLAVIEATPVAAFELTPDVTIGAGLRIQHAKLKLTSIIDAGGVAAAFSVPGFAPGSSDLYAEFDASDTAIGYSVGMQAALTDNFRVGLAYISKVDHDFDGDVSFDIAGSAAAQILNVAAGLFDANGFATEFATPATASAGFRYQASGKMVLMGSVRRMFWSEFEGVTLSFNDGATPPEVMTQNWSDSWLASIGGEYAVTPDTTLRAGFMFDESPVNDAFAHPRIPDSDRYWLAAGVTHELGENVSADIGVAYAFFSDRQVQLSGAEPENLFRGSLGADFETNVLAISVGLRWKF